MWRIRNWQQSDGFDKQRLEKLILQKYSEVKDIVPTESNTADGDKLALWVCEAFLTHSQ